METRCVYVDAVGFTIPPRFFFPREIAILCPEKPAAHAFFKQPVAFQHLNPRCQRHVTWCYRQLHGFRWTPEEGHSLEMLGLFLHAHIPDGSIIVASNKEMAAYLFEFGPSGYYVALEELDLDNLCTENRDDHCRQHTNRCALENVMAMERWGKVNNISSSDAFLTRIPVVEEMDFNE